MSLTPADVEKVSLLARLSLSSEELSLMTAQLDQIVQYIDQLAELNTEGVEPMSHPVETENVLADDLLLPSLPRELALANAPKADEECFRVPAVLGE